MNDVVPAGNPGSAHAAREGWEAAFRAAAGTPDELLLDIGPNCFDQDEWEW